MADSDSDQAGIPLIEDLSDSPEPQPSKSSKRKRDADDADIDSKKAARKARRKLKKPKDVDDDTLDSVLGISKAIGYMDSSLMADHIAQRTKRFQPDLSFVEAEDWRIPESAITDTTSFSQDRVTDSLPTFLEQFAGARRKKQGKKLENAPNEKGAPHTIVVAGAGLRAADLTRALRKFQTKEAMVAKLFAKHIKLKEAVETCKKTRMNIGVGTPQRIMDLLDDGALSTKHLERIVVDASHIDQKKRGVLDMKELQVPLVKLLTREDLKERYGSGEGKLELMFY
ncbi:uncharacterized protein MYCFIDRAFT_29694 [Pseudocercospora fijiensis CIRAD86]|uniref:Uncharacterized protein n=1 Tax=Pseudocercospora fijiensis (strain CIRAD86) TaxID=383855 RepID=M3BBA5_PSEFD|nr:uncharacterized protein MYCFIDRAFT_29694 [Pseudocercospora fijiensis CIRAD86]EME86582.1 hypothetical protein MYCFIDRAFT_29694 [Pseudocercospora fijiensis CIRAD86]